MVSDYSVVNWGVRIATSAEGRRCSRRIGQTLIVRPRGKGKSLLTRTGAVMPWMHKQIRCRSGPLLSTCLLAPRTLRFAKLCISIRMMFSSACSSLLEARRRETALAEIKVYQTARRAKAFLCALCGLYYCCGHCRSRALRNCSYNGVRRIRLHALTGELGIGRHLVTIIVSICGRKSLAIT